MAKVFCIDVSRCSGCYNCQFACKDEHCNNEWLPIAKQQPLTGQFWLKLEEHVEGSRPKIRIHYIPVLCNHCEHPACMEAAPDAVYRREDGLVIIDPIKAAGHKELADACPYGAIYWNEALQIPQKCTGCAHLVDDGKTPRCVDVCHTGAIRFGEESEFADFIAEAKVMKPEVFHAESLKRIQQVHRLFLNEFPKHPSVFLFVKSRSSSGVRHDRYRPRLSCSLHPVDQVHIVRYPVSQS